MASNDTPHSINQRTYNRDLLKAEDREPPKPPSMRPEDFQERVLKRLRSGETLLMTSSRCWNFDDGSKAPDGACRALVASGKIVAVGDALMPDLTDKHTPYHSQTWRLSDDQTKPAAVSPGADPGAK